MTSLSVCASRCRCDAARASYPWKSPTKMGRSPARARLRDMVCATRLSISVRCRRMNPSSSSASKGRTESS